VVISNPYPQRKVLWLGNSLSNLDSNANAVNGQYVPITTYNSLTKSKLSLFSYAVSGYTQTTINSLLGSNIGVMLNAKDIIVNWEGTNDMGINNLSGAAAFANLVTACQYVTSRGGIFVVGTVAARDMSGDAVDLMDRIDAYNVLVRANNGTYGYYIADIAANVNFATRAAASNLTYYKADKIHMATAGQNLCATIFQSTIQPLL